MKSVYGFKEQLKKGKTGEKVLDKYFAKWYNISNATLEEEKQGFDRRFRPKGQRGIQLVEYKTDSKTQTTGNVFVETMSVMEMGRYGWAWTSRADIVVYFALPDTLYIFNPQTIREKIPEWELKYGLRLVKNKSYHSAGIPVPEEEFAKACKSTRRLSDKTIQELL